MDRDAIDLGYSLQWISGRGVCEEIFWLGAQSAGL